MIDEVFIDKQHQEEFECFFSKSDYSTKDIERVCLFYILSFLKRDKPVERLYDFKEEGVLPNNTEEMMLSSSQKSLVRLAFHLFTGRDHHKATIVNTFYHLSGDYKQVAFNAIFLYIDE